MIAAYVDGAPLAAQEVYDRLAAMRRGPAAALLPDASTAEGRQLVRWLTQVAVTDQVLCDEAVRRGLSQESPPWPLDPTSKVQLGGALAAVLASSPSAVAAAHDITSDVRAGPAQLERDQPGATERWVTSSGAGGPDNGGRSWLVELASLPTALAEQVGTGAAGDVVDGAATRYVLGEWAEPRPARIPTYDGAVAARNLALSRWVDERVASVVTLEHGFEHPGDITQPDHTHRH
jgi:[acyl-carrier-protein] S-malonyltransferase